MIGIFDSGLGGLTALKELHALVPGEELLKQKSAAATEVHF